jgi:hypothetical protein
MKQKPTAHYPSNTIFKQHFIIVGYELGSGLAEGNLHETVDVVCDYLQPDNTVDPIIDEFITKKDIKEVIEQQFIKRRGDCYIANPLLLYCVDDDYFLDEKRYAAQIKAAKRYYGILL